MNAAVSTCAKYLQNRSIKFLQEWLEACIEWISEENNGLPHPNELTNLVYEQWLMADLREISIPSFPSGLTERKEHSILKGNFAVQVNLIMDIGHSAYSQLQKIKGQEIHQIDEGDEEDDTKDFFNKAAYDFDKNSKKSQYKSKGKEKSSRMLFLELNDGTQSVEAIEYEPLNDITIEQVLPGGKVLLIGPIKCFDGVLLLKHGNLRFLGGNTEELMEKMTQEKLLCNILKIDHDQKDFANIKNENSIHANSLNNNLQTNNRTGVDIKHENDRDQGQTHSRQSSTSHLQNQRNLQSSSNTRKKDFSRNAAVSQQQKKSNNLFEENLFNDDDLFEDDLNDLDDWDNDLEKLDDWDINPGRDSNSIIDVNPRSTTYIGQKKTANNGPSKNSSNYNVVIENEIDSPEEGDIWELDNNDFRFESKLTKSSNLSNSKLSVCNDRQIKQKKDIAYIKRTKQIEKNVGEKSAIENENKESKKIKFNTENQSNTFPKKPFDNCIIPEPGFDDFDDNNLTESERKESDCENPVDELNLEELTDYDEPIQYLFTLKGWMKTFASKLNYQSEYRLNVIVTDNTSLHVQMLLGNEALTALVGFEAHEVYAAAKGHTSQIKKARIKEAVKNAEKALEKYQWVFQIKFDEEDNIYRIMKMNANGIAHRR